MGQMPAILIVDDHPLFRDALEVALQSAFPTGSTIAHAESLTAALTLMAQSSFNLVLLDLTLSDSEGFEGLSRISAAGYETPVVVVSATDTADAFTTARNLGARGYLPKSLSLNDLSAALVTVLDGGTWFPEADTDGENEAAKKISSLTPAQRKVLTGLSDGLLNKQIAFDMGISTATVKAHMTAIFRKLGANNRTQALLIYKEAVKLSNHSAA